MRCRVLADGAVPDVDQMDWSAFRARCSRPENASCPPRVVSISREQSQKCGLAHLQMLSKRRLSHATSLGQRLQNAAVALRERECGLPPSQNDVVRLTGEGRNCTHQSANAVGTLRHYARQRTNI